MLEFVVFLLVCAIMMGPHVVYLIRAVKHICVIWQAYLLGTYANNVKFMYTTICRDIFDCGELIWGICTGVVVWYMHMKHMWCYTHEIQGKSRELLGIRYIGQCDLFYSKCGMLHVWYTPGAAGVGYDTQPLRNSNVL